MRKMQQMPEEFQNLSRMEQQRIIYQTVQQLSKAARGG